MKRLRQTSLAAVLLLSGSAGYAQTPATSAAPDGPNFKVQIWGEIAADFTARVEAYMDLRRTLEKGLPPLTVTDNPAEITRAERALARRIRLARAGARQGDIFTPDVQTDFRRVLLVETDAETLTVIMDDNPGAFTRRINATYPKERPLATMPANLLAVLPRLPDDIQYRFLGSHLVLHDIRANVILDRLPCAIRCTN